jgi:hypothetical protein
MSIAFSFFIKLLLMMLRAVVLLFCIGVGFVVACVEILPVLQGHSQAWIHDQLVLCSPNQDSCQGIVVHPSRASTCSVP